MAKNPSSIFYWNDWENEAGLMLCSPSAQAAWFRMLCAMARATPRGHFKIGRRIATVEDLARIMGQDRESVAGWLAELEGNGVFSRTKRKTIFCRRMVREVTLTRHRQVAGRHGGEVKARNQKEKTASKILAKPWQNPSKSLAPLDSGTVGASSESPSPLPSPLTPPPAPSPSEESEEKEEQVKIERDPEGGRFAPLGDLARPIVERLTARSPPKPKGQALQAQIKAQLAWKHVRYLTATGPPGEDMAYFALIDGKTCMPPQAIFDAVDARMRAAGWDDTAEHRIAA